jgi:hypothetical protein
MDNERTYLGESDEGHLQEALSNALQKLDAAIAEDGVRDASASWTLAEISGLYGGFAGFTKVKARIVAKRSPDWDSDH